MIRIWGESITWLELAASGFGIAGVWLTVKKNILCFPTGIVNVALYTWLFFQSHLYTDALLQVVYVILLIYGWYQWHHVDAEKEPVKITALPFRTLWMLAGIALVFTLGVGAFFHYNTDASYPYADALTTSMSLIAQWMIAKKKIENWLLWIVADVIYICMYLLKHLYPTSVLYFIFIVLAVIGWIRWKKEMSVEPAATSAHA